MGLMVPCIAHYEALSVIYRIHTFSQHLSNVALCMNWILNESIDYGSLKYDFPD